MAESREIRAGEENIHPFKRRFLDFFERAGEKSPSERRKQAAKELGKQGSEGWLFKGGAVQGVTLLGLAGGLIGDTRLGEIWKKYGKDAFYSWSGFKKQFNAVKGKFQTVAGAIG